MAIHLMKDKGVTLKRALETGFYATEVRFMSQYGGQDLMQRVKFDMLDIRLENSVSELLDSDAERCLDKPTLVLYVDSVGSAGAVKHELLCELQLIVNRAVTSGDALAGNIYLDAFVALCQIVLQDPQEVTRFIPFGLKPQPDTFQVHDVLNGDEIHPGIGDRVLGRSITIRFFDLEGLSHGAA